MSRRNDRDKKKDTAADVAALADELGSSYLRGCADQLARREQGDIARFTEGPRDSRNYGWAGPGTSGTTSRREARDNVLLDKAIKRLTSKVKIPGSEQFRRVSFDEAVRRINPFDDDFSRRTQQVENVFNEGFHILLQNGDPNNANQKFQKVVELAYALEKDILEKLVELGIHNTGFVPGYLASVYTFQAMSQGHFGDSSQDTIDSATEGIRLWNLVGGMDGEAGITILLVVRGGHTRRLGSLEESLIDFRGACAYIRGNPLWDRQPSIGEVTHEILHTMAMIKHRDNAPRPHYTEQEQKKWMKELGIRDYSQDIYVCGNCGVKRSETVKLFRCNGCQTKWYCSKSCLVNAWKNKGHKDECKIFRMGLVRKIENEAVVRANESIEKHGFAAMTGNVWLFRDPNKGGQYFDSLTDRDFRLEEMSGE